MQKDKSKCYQLVSKGFCKHTLHSSWTDSAKVFFLLEGNRYISVSKNPSNQVGEWGGSKNRYVLYISVDKVSLKFKDLFDIITL